MTGGGRTCPFPPGLAAAASELFVQRGGAAQAVAVNQDDSFNSADSPVSKGSYLSFWVSGQGAVDLTGAYATPAAPVRVTPGGVQTDVAFAGLISAGVMQVNIRVPDDAPAGNAVELIITAGSSSSRKSATVAIH